jgi:hypothetical protein
LDLKEGISASPKEGITSTSQWIYFLPSENLLYKNNRVVSDV